jgi:hypothetical protein
MPLGGLASPSLRAISAGKPPKRGTKIEGDDRRHRESSVFAAPAPDQISP